MLDSLQKKQALTRLFFSHPHSFTDYCPRLPSYSTFFAKLVVFVPFMERIWSRYWTKVQRFGRKWDKIGPLNQIKGRKFCKKGAKTGLFAWEMGNLYEGSVASPFQPPPTSSRPSPPRVFCAKNWIFCVIKE